MLFPISSSAAAAAAFSFMRLTKLKLAGFKSFVDPTTSRCPGSSSASSGRMVAASRT
jgi:hypothetical protein